MVDANSGRTLYSVAEDGLRHPASITKVMTLYLLFEQLEKGAMTLQTRIPVSEHAAAQEPSKLGVEPGETISVEDAIKAVVTRSANDVAVAIAEAIGRDESSFAEMMTRKAHALGMSNTVYRNASGLPNDEQVTTARDLSILGRSLEERFPRYFKYFSTREFEYAGETIGNHNHLLGRVDGVDGIKTGYTRASGFNLLTSVHRDGRSLIAVVMGGRTAGARDRVMENLIDDHIAEASTVRTATMVADASGARGAAAPPAAQEASPARPRPAVVAANVPARAPSAAPRRRRSRKATTPRRTARRRCASPPSSPPSSRTPRPTPVPRATSTPRPTPLRVAAEPRRGERAASEPRQERTPAQLGWVKGPDAAQKAGASRDRRADPAREAQGRRAETTVAAADAPLKPDDAEDAGSGKGWMIQIGATDDAAKATALLDKARQRSRSILGGGQAGHREGAQGRGHVLPRALRRPRSRPRRKPPAAPSNATASPASPPVTDEGTSSPGPPFLASERLALSLHQNILGLIDPRGKSGRAAMIWMKLLHQGSVRANDFRRARALRQAQISSASRRDMEPAALRRRGSRLTLVCLTPAGKPAVEISL